MHPSLDNTEVCPSDHLLSDAKGTIALSQVLETTNQIQHFAYQARMHLPRRLVTHPTGDMLQQQLKIEI